MLQPIRCTHLMYTDCCIYGVVDLLATHLLLQVRFGTQSSCLIALVENKSLGCLSCGPPQAKLRELEPEGGGVEDGSAAATPAAPTLFSLPELQPAAELDEVKISE